MKIPKGIVEDVLVKVDKFYYPMDFVVLDTELVPTRANYVPIILGRPFSATSNALINCRNGVMELTFGNMTMELNILHLNRKHVHPEEEGLEEVCLIDTIMEEYCAQKLQEELRNDAYLNSKIFKERSKKWHDQMVARKNFQKGDKVLSFKVNGCHLKPYTVPFAQPVEFVPISTQDFLAIKASVRNFSATSQTFTRTKAILAQI